VLEGVAIGRRASLQSNVDAAVDSLTTSAAEPWTQGTSDVHLNGHASSQLANNGTFSHVM